MLTFKQFCDKHYINEAKAQPKLKLSFNESSKSNSFVIPKDYLIQSIQDAPDDEIEIKATKDGTIIMGLFIHPYQTN